MSYGDLEERPAKKRRFFVDDSPAPDTTLTAETSLPDEVNALEETESGPASEGGKANGNGSDADFDVSLLESFVGEPLPLSTIERLKELSGNNVERGKVVNRVSQARLRQLQLLISTSTAHGKSKELKARSRQHQVSSHLKV